MTRHRQLPKFQIMRVSEDSIGPFAKLKVFYPDGTLMIRIGLDRFTCSKLGMAASTRCFDKLPGLDYTYWLLLKHAFYRNTDRHEGYIECSLGKQTKELKFECSSLFASNLVWLNGIKSIKQLEELDWDKWVTDDQPL